MPGFEPEMLHETAEAVVPGSNPASITVRKKILRIGRSLCIQYCSTSGKRRKPPPEAKEEEGKIGCPPCWGRVRRGEARGRCPPRYRRRACRGPQRWRGTCRTPASGTGPSHHPHLSLCICTVTVGDSVHVTGMRRKLHK